MKTVTYIIISLLSTGWLYGQTVFDIEIDEIYLDNEEIIFINSGEANTYVCELVPKVIKDFKYNIILECEENNNWMGSDSPVKINFDQLIRFEKPKDLTKYISRNKFANSSNKSDKENNAFLQYFSEHLIAILDFDNDDSININWQFKRVEFYNYVFIRINGEFLVIALVDEEEPSPIGFIIPMKDKLLVVSDNSSFYKDGECIDSINLLERLPFNNFYRVKSNQNGQEITDMLFDRKFIEKEFKNVKINENSIIGYSDNKAEIYDLSGIRIDINHIKAAHDAWGSIQCIIKNEIKWIDYQWKIHDTFPKPIWYLCGTISSTERKIEKINNKFYESSTTGYWHQVEDKDSTLLIDDRSVNEITYLNNQNYDAYDEHSDLLSVFSFPYHYYISTKENAKQLIAITNNRKTRERELIIERDYYNKNQIEKDSINVLIEKLEEDMSSEVIFTGNIESFGYNHPIKFESGGLFGYYPQNKIAKYRKIEKFNFFFAKFEDKDGRSGWLDIYGKEYY